jgi:hypothetical protein
LAAISHNNPGYLYLLNRRNRRMRELAFYRYYRPQPVTLPAPVKVAGTGGPSRRTSRPARAWPAWTSTRAAGPFGTGGSPLAMLAAAVLTMAAIPAPATQIR